MATIVYTVIVAYILGLVVWNLYALGRVAEQLTAALVLIPLLLRLLGIK